jgi:hypothetical protein
MARRRPISLRRFRNTETCERLACAHLLPQASGERLQKHIQDSVAGRVASRRFLTSIERKGCAQKRGEGNLLGAALV